VEKTKKSSVVGVSVGREPISATDDVAKPPMGQQLSLLDPGNSRSTNARQACVILEFVARLTLLVDSSKYLLERHPTPKGL